MEKKLKAAEDRVRELKKGTSVVVSTEHLSEELLTAKEREKALEAEVGDLQCQIRLLVAEKDGFKALAEAEKERCNEIEKKVNVAKTAMHEMLIEESRHREAAYNRFHENYTRNTETASRTA